MAYDSLKNIIRQYIKTNGEQEITGQIMQNVLIEMVNNYPSTDGYATQSWVNTQLAGYLPLSGGTMTGSINFMSSAAGINFSDGSQGIGDISYSSLLDGLLLHSNRKIVLDCNTIWAEGNLTATSFIKDGGTSSQFLKADGSVDSNSYLPLSGGTMAGSINFTSPLYGINFSNGSQGSGDIGWSSDYAGVSLHSNTKIVLDSNTIWAEGNLTATSFIKDGGTSSQFLKADGSVDSNSYLPLSGGTMTGSINFMSSAAGINFSDGSQGIGDISYSSLLDGLLLHSNRKIVLDCNTIWAEGNLTATSFIKDGGTSSQFLKADGSVDSNSYLPLSGGTMAGSINFTSPLYGINFSNGSQGSGDIGWSSDYAGVSLHSNTKIVLDSNTIWAEGNLTATSFIKDGGTSSQFLKADGSVDSSAYITSAALADYLPLSGGTMTGSINFTSSLYGINFSNGSQGSGDIGWSSDYAGVSLHSNTKIVLDSNTIWAEGNLTATSFIKDGGTSAQFLKADGSVDSSAYITSAALAGYLPLSGGTMTGSIHSNYSGAAYYWGTNDVNYIGGNANVDNYIHIGDNLPFYIYVGSYTTLTCLQKKVGIHTPAPAYSLTVTNTQQNEWCTNIISDTCSIFMSHSAGYGIGVRSSTFSDSIFLMELRNNLESYNEDTFVMRAMSNGNVGFGVRTPLYKVHVRGTVYCDYLKSSGFLTSDAYYSHPSLGSLLVRDESVGLIVRGGKYGLFSYVLGSGNTFLQSGRCDGVTDVYNICLQYLGGNVGIGTATPAYKLDVNGSANATTLYENGTTLSSKYLALTGGTLTGDLTLDNRLIFNGSIRSIKFDTYTYISHGGSKLRIVHENNTGDIIIGNYDNRNYTSIVNDLQGGTTDGIYNSVTQNWLIQNSGDAYFKSVGQQSDIRYKNVIGDVILSLYNVANSPLFKFTWKDETKETGQHIGTAAQYWQTILPELVSMGTEKNPKMSMQYDVVALASAITVAREVVDHERRIVILERENEELRKELAALKSA